MTPEAMRAFALLSLPSPDEGGTALRDAERAEDLASVGHELAALTCSDGLRFHRGVDDQVHLLDEMSDAAATVREEDDVHVVASPRRVGDRLEAIASAIAHVEMRAEPTREARGGGESAAAIGDARVASVVY